jgi:translation initiation factor 1
MEAPVKIRLEKNGRGGKTVTVLFELPPRGDPFYETLLKNLKGKCGAGGTYKDRRLEIQGDHRDKIKTFLEAQGFQVKLAGG